MHDSARIKRVQFKVGLNCRLCNKEFEDYVSDPTKEAICTQNNCFESQPFDFNNIKEIHFDIESSSPFYSITAVLIVDHEKKSFIPGDTGAFYGSQYLDIRIVKSEIKELLRKKGSELEEEDFWKGYTFVDDFSRIKTI